MKENKSAGTKKSDNNIPKEIKVKSPHSDIGGIYGFGILGAAVYFLQRADTFGEGAIGIVKAIFWPSFVVYRLFEFLKF